MPDRAENSAAWTDVQVDRRDTGPPPLAPRPPTIAIYLIAVLGGAAGTVAAIWEEGTRATWLMAVLVAPAIEEICKPIAIVLLLDKRPHWLRRRSEVVVLAFLSAAVFATLENLLYVYSYVPDASPDFVLWRFTVCTALHLSASTVFGLGLAKMWQHQRTHGGRFDIDVCFRYYVVAVAVHAAYNATVMLLHITDVLVF
jgi:RsiW-degrading membrane proteinase PrsW (M82 family)